MTKISLEEYRVLYFARAVKQLTTFWGTRTERTMSRQCALASPGVQERVCQASLLHSGGHLCLGCGHVLYKDTDAVELGLFADFILTGWKTISE